MKIAYQNWDPKPAARAIIRTAEAICAEYAAQGYDLTLRQLYYQFVARGIIENSQRSYKRLGSIVNDARLAGMLDWDYIVDRTRNLGSVGHWDTPEEIIDGAASQYRVDKWSEQPVRVEVWVEKEALAGVIERTARALDVAWFSCRGYVSQSELWGAAQRHLRYIEGGQRVVVLHLGDHDPSGIDMTRDIRDRLTNFTHRDWWRNHPELSPDGTTSYGAIARHMQVEAGLDGDPLEVRRIALNMDQIEEYNPPPNPAKITDSRARSYIEEYGRESWELDALDPAVLDALVREHVEDLRDDDLYEVAEQEETEQRAALRDMSNRYEDLVAYMEENPA